MFYLVWGVTGGDLLLNKTYAGVAERWPDKDPGLAGTDSRAFSAHSKTWRVAEMMLQHLNIKPAVPFAAGSGVKCSCCFT